MKQTCVWCISFASRVPKKKEEAEKLAPLGEYIAFYSMYTEFGDGCIKAKALMTVSVVPYFLKY